MNNEFQREEFITRAGLGGAVDIFRCEDRAVPVLNIIPKPVPHGGTFASLSYVYAGSDRSQSTGLSLDLAVGASYLGRGKIDSHVEWKASTQIQDFARNFALRYEKLLDWENITIGAKDVLDEVKAAAKQAKSYLDFAKTYGTHIVTGTRRAGTVQVNVSLQGMDFDEARSLGLRINAEGTFGPLGVSAAVNYDDNLRTIVSQRQINISVTTQPAVQGIENIPPTLINKNDLVTLNDILDRVKVLIANVQKSGDGYEVSYALTPWYTVLGTTIGGKFDFEVVDTSLMHEWASNRRIFARLDDLLKNPYYGFLGTSYRDELRPWQAKALYNMHTIEAYYASAFSDATVPQQTLGLINMDSLAYRWPYPGLEIDYARSDGYDTTLGFAAAEIRVISRSGFAYDSVKAVPHYSFPGQKSYVDESNGKWPDDQVRYLRKWDVKIPIDQAINSPEKWTIDLMSKGETGEPTLISSIPLGTFPINP